MQEESSKEMMNKMKLWSSVRAVAEVLMIRFIFKIDLTSPIKNGCHTIFLPSLSACGVHL